MFRKFATIFSTVGVFVVGFVFIGILGQLRPELDRNEYEAPPPSVFYEVARAQDVTLDVISQGEVRPRTDIILTAQVSGEVMRLSDRFVDGGAFKKGDMLIKIEDSTYRASAAAARARVAQAEELLRREEAESALARRDFEDLGRDEEPNALVLRVPQLAQARANYEAAKSEARAAQINLDRTTIRAPFDGRVRQRGVGLGQFVSPGAQLGRIFATDIAEIRLPLNDLDLARLGLPIAFVESENDPGPSVQLSAVIAGQMQNWEARVARTDAAIDPTTRLMGAIAVVKDPYGTGSDNGVPLPIGLFVDAVINGRPYQNAYVLPRTALYGRDLMYAINAEDKIETRTVQIVSSSRDTVTVSSGLREGDRIVTSPLRGATVGDTVAPTDPAVISISNDNERASRETASLDLDAALLSAGE